MQLRGRKQASKRSTTCWFPPPRLCDQPQTDSTAYRIHMYGKELCSYTYKAAAMPFVLYHCSYSCIYCIFTTNHCCWLGGHHLQNCIWLSYFALYLLTRLHHQYHRRRSYWCTHCNGSVSKGITGSQEPINFWKMGSGTHQFFINFGKKGLKSSLFSVEIGVGNLN